MSASTPAFDALRVMSLIHDIDVGLTNPEESYPESYLHITRWRNGSGNTDLEATTIIRALLRQELEKVPIDELGRAALREIDSRTSAAEGGDS